MQETEIMEMPTVPATFRQLGILVLDGSGSMTLPIDSLSGQASKADAVNIAVRELMTRMQASRKSQNFSFAFVNFHETVSHATPIMAVADVDDNGDFDPTSHGSGGTFVGSGLEAAGRLCAQFLADPAETLPSSVVVLLMGDGECSDPERTRGIADRIKADERVAIAAAYFGTKGVSDSAGPALLQEVCSDPVRLYKTVYDGEALRKFFLASMTAAASRIGGDDGSPV
jgi:von Willebrand factor type A domain